jgi:hypothetical protein
MIRTETSKLSRVGIARRQQDDGQASMLGANRLGQMRPRPFAQTGVEQHKPRGVNGDFSFCLGRSCGMADDVSIFCQSLPKYLAENGVIFNQQESRRAGTRGHCVEAPKEVRDGGKPKLPGP